MRFMSTPERAKIQDIIPEQDDNSGSNCIRDTVELRPALSLRRELSVNLDEWIAQQVRRSAAAMERAISATHLVRHRAAFDQTVRPLPGSVLASPEIADWNPE